MKKTVLSFLLCMITLTGCNLAYREAIETAAEPIYADLNPAPLPSDSEVLLVLQSEVLTGQPVTGCSPRSDWPVYVVIGGDTLSDIALRFNSTVVELTAANCLENPRLIIVQQRLFVPRSGS